MNNWKDITRDNVIKAINKYLSGNYKHPCAISTFLLYEGHILPAKHIRGMAYEVAYGKAISKEEYSGGIETVNFFERLGFDVIYKGKSQRKKSVVEETESIKCNLKIGLYLQTEKYKNLSSFTKAMERVKQTDFDVLVFPEFSYVPFIEQFTEADTCNEADMKSIYDSCLELSEKIGKAIVINNSEKYGAILSVFANAFADNNETRIATYIKHTMTSCSAFDFDNYKELSETIFEPIIYKGYKIGITTCYDCNHSIFSRMYALKDVDIILNSTGGDVIYDKWYKYNKVRAIENCCYNLVTMGGEISNPKSFVYGFNPQGKELKYHGLLKDVDNPNDAGNIYIFDLSEDDGESSCETGINQRKTLNKNWHIEIPVGDVGSIIKKCKKIEQNLFIYHFNNENIVFCIVNGDDIMKPERVLTLLYSDKLKSIDNKRYIIVNRHERIDRKFFEDKLSVLLKVRAMENFCAVILESENICNCYQSGKNRTAQVVEPENGFYRIDLDRTTGPEAIWKTKPGMKASWRTNAEWLIKKLSI